MKNFFTLIRDVVIIWGVSASQARLEPIPFGGTRVGTGSASFTTHIVRSHHSRINYESLRLVYIRSLHSVHHIKSLSYQSSASSSFHQVITHCQCQCFYRTIRHNHNVLCVSMIFCKLIIIHFTNIGLIRKVRNKWRTILWEYTYRHRNITSISPILDPATWKRLKRKKGRERKL